MKKTFILSILAVLFLSSNVLAQGPYVKLKGGYGIPILKMKTGTDLNGVDAIYTSYGHGIPLSLTVGSTIEKHWGVEMDFTYQIGVESDIDEATIVTKGKANQFRLAPSLVVFTGYEGMDFHARFGATLGLSTNVTNELLVGGALFENTMKGHFGLGAVSAFGFTYKLVDQVYFMGEMEIISQMIKIKEERNSVTDTVTSYDSDNASKFPMSSLNFNVGFKYSLK